MSCVLICVLISLSTPALGHGFYSGNYYPWQSSPHNNWHRWNNPGFYDGSRSFHSFTNDHLHHPFEYFGANDWRHYERGQNDYRPSGHIQHPFEFFGAHLASNSEKKPNNSPESGPTHPFEYYESQAPREIKLERRDFGKADNFLVMHSTSLDPVEYDGGGIKYIDTGHILAKHGASLDPVKPAGDIEFIDTDYFEAASRSEFIDSNDNIDAGNSVEQCMVNDMPGTCLNIKACPELNKLLKEQPRKPSTLPYLNKLRCGFDGLHSKVCCPAQQTGISETVWEKPPDVSSHRNLPLLPTDCGQLDEPRILGGQRAALFEFPWMVLIAYKSVPDQVTKLSCGGTLISSRYVLTAAHCVTNLTRLTLVGVVLGDLNIQTDPDCENMDGVTICASPAQNVTVEEVISHPGYNTKLHNDIALIRLSEPADFQQDNIRPVCLPITNEFQNLNLIGLNATVLGWGATESGVQSQHLLKVALPIVSNDDCSSIYKSATEIWYKQMCAGGERDRDSCGGDSGGPIVFPGKLNKQVRYVQHGIVSFGHRRCGNGGFPGVYTRIAYYMDWILDNMRP